MRSATRAHRCAGLDEDRRANRAKELRSGSVEQVQEHLRAKLMMYVHILMENMYPYAQVSGHLPVNSTMTP